MDRRPPARWFYRTVETLKRKPGISDPETMAGWIWAHKIGLKKKAEIIAEETGTRGGKMAEKEKTELEKMVDKAGLKYVLLALSQVCYEKSAFVMESVKGAAAGPLARAWQKNAGDIAGFSEKIIDI